MILSFTKNYRTVTLHISQFHFQVNHYIIYFYKVTSVKIINYTIFRCRWYNYAVHRTNKHFSNRINRKSMYIATSVRLIEFVRGSNRPRRYDRVVESRGFQTIPDSAGLNSKFSLAYSGVRSHTGLIHRPGMFKCLTFALRGNPLVPPLIRAKKGWSTRDQDEI